MKCCTGLLAALLSTILVSGCDQSMTEQYKYTPYAPSSRFTDGASARPLVNGTVAIDAPVGPRPEHIPGPITMALLRRGQERYAIYCAPCHGLVGNGEGIVVEYGFPQPPSYMRPELLQAPDKHFFNVISNGKGKMYSYADRVQPADRWAIVAYIRALQLSQHAKPSDVPAGITLANESP